RHLLRERNLPADRLAQAHTTRGAGEELWPAPGRLRQPPADPDYQRYIFASTVSGTLDTDAVRSPVGTVPRTFSHHMLVQEPIRVVGPPAYHRLVPLPCSDNHRSGAGGDRAGGMRELHWHPNADEWQYYLAGRGRMTVFASGGRARTFDYQAGDVGYMPFAMGHYVANTGEETLTF